MGCCALESGDAVPAIPFRNLTNCAAQPFRSRQQEELKMNRNRSKSRVNHTMPLGGQQTSQHPRAGERKLQMQPVEATEHIGCPFLKLRFPRRDLIGMNVELFGKLRQCPIALDGSKRHLGLERWCVVPAWSA